MKEGHDQCAACRKMGACNRYTFEAVPPVVFTRSSIIEPSLVIFGLDFVACDTNRRRL